MTDSSPYYVAKIAIKQLWGERNITIRFQPDVNILIGPNGSGKTTILNLLQFILAVDLKSLAQIRFDKVTVSLSAFNSGPRKLLSVIPIEQGYRYTLAGVDYDVPVETSNLGRLLRRTSSGRLIANNVQQDVRDTLQELVPTVWLSVSRRLPVAKEDESQINLFSPPEQHLESVDQRLRHLMEALSSYRVRLDAQMASRYKDFEKHVLREILYSKENDVYERMGSLPKAHERDRLIRAFKAVRLFDADIERRINEHFEAAAEALQRVQKGQALNVSDLFVLPLIRRTNSLVEFARKLDTERDELFEPLTRYSQNVDGFLRGKRLRVLSDGRISIESTQTEGRQFSVDQLSSGEKQLLILLTEALLREDNPVVYVADEPELSLHVTWQSMLLKSLQEVGGRMQIIVATHSPDIVGQFVNNVIELPANE